MEIKEKLTNMFSKVMAGTVTREEGTMLLNHLVKENQAETVKDLVELIEKPPSGVFAKTILHTIALARNKAFNNIMISCIDHEDESVSILASQELARQRTDEAKRILLEHLNSESYHVRKASAAAIAAGFQDGVEILKEHVVGHPGEFFRATSAQAMASVGRKGIEALLGLLVSDNPGVVASAAEALSTAGDSIPEGDIPKIIDSLMLAGDRKDSRSLVEIIKVVGSLKSRAARFEKYVAVFSDYPHEPVKKEVQSALKKISAGA